MAKQGMKRPNQTHVKPRNEMPPVPELQGKAKNSDQPARPVISGSSGPSQKVLHTERPISRVYPEIDNDLARDNMENDLSAAEVQDL